MREKKGNHYKKLLKAAILSLILGMFVIMPQKIVNASNQNMENVTYDYGTYDVRYIVDGVWCDGYNVRVIVTNKTDEQITDWEMVFLSKDSIINIWNAKVVYNENDIYIINNNDWNREIPANGSIEWGYTAQYSSFPTYGSDFEVREKITEDVSHENFENLLDAIINSDFEDGDCIVIDNAYIIECVEEDLSTPMLRATTYTKTKSAKFFIKVLSTYKQAFTMQQKMTYVVNSVKDTVRITSHQLTVSGATLVKHELQSRLNVEVPTVMSSYVSVQVKYKKKNYYFLGRASAYSTGGSTLSFTQL